MDTREFDIILYGATGFTGRQAAKYLGRFAPPSVRWAVAARDRARLGALDAGVPAIVAAASDKEAIEAMTRRTRIVLSTAGPFAQYSDAVVDACVRRGTHYVDITGETVWVRSLIDRYHRRAAEAGTRIIPFCGFDSVPADLGAAAVSAQLGESATEVKAYYQAKSGRPNGGTVATGLQGEFSAEPFLLAPDIARAPLPIETDPNRAAFDADIRAWVAPFLMGPINTRVVRRSCALRGTDFAYQEYLKTAGPAQAFFAAAAGELLSYSLRNGMLRAMLRRLAPKPGTGPSEQAMNGGWFRCEFFGRAADGRTARLTVSGEGDPANRITVKCVCEAALALACDEPALPDRAGVLTPSTGLGEALRRRLEAAGLAFSTP